MSLIIEFDDKGQFKAIKGKTNVKSIQGKGLIEASILPYNPEEND